MTERPPHPLGAIAATLSQECPPWTMQCSQSSAPLVGLASDGSVTRDHDGGYFCLTSGLTHIIVCSYTVHPVWQEPWLHFWLCLKPGCRTEQRDLVKPQHWTLPSSMPAPLPSGIWSSSGLFISENSQGTSERRHMQPISQTRTWR